MTPPRPRLSGIWHTSERSRRGDIIRAANMRLRNQRKREESVMCPHCKSPIGPHPSPAIKGQKLIMCAACRRAWLESV